MASRRADQAVLVIGLGRFGSAVAESLAAAGHEVLAVDDQPERVQEWAGRLTSVVELDSTSEEAMRQIGAADFQRVVVGIGAVEPSILTVGVLVDLGVPQIWAKALTRAHGRILERVGATEVVYPEHDMGEKVAYMVAGRVKNYLEFDDGFVLVETPAPADVVGRTLREAGLRSRYGVTVVCIKVRGGGFTYATPDTLVPPGALLVVAGDKERAERFAADA